MIYQILSGLINLGLAIGFCITIDRAWKHKQLSFKSHRMSGPFSRVRKFTYVLTGASLILAMVGFCISVGLFTYATLTAFFLPESTAAVLRLMVYGVLVALVTLIIAGSIATRYEE